MTREYQTLIGDGRECVTVHYTINGDFDDFEIEVESIMFVGVDIMGCVLTQQIVEIEMEIIKAINLALSGLADI